MAEPPLHGDIKRLGRLLRGVHSVMQADLNQTGGHREWLMEAMLVMAILSARLVTDARLNGFPEAEADFLGWMKDSLQDWAAGEKGRVG